MRRCRKRYCRTPEPVTVDTASQPAGAPNRHRARPLTLPRQQPQLPPPPRQLRSIRPSASLPASRPASPSPNSGTPKEHRAARPWRRRLLGGALSQGAQARGHQAAGGRGSATARRADSAPGGADPRLKLATGDFFTGIRPPTAAAPCAQAGRQTPGPRRLTRRLPSRHCRAIRRRNRNSCSAASAAGWRSSSRTSGNRDAGAPARRRPAARGSCRWRHAAGPGSRRSRPVCPGDDG